MAPTRKDVELVIRARDQAGRAVDTITDAIKALVGQQEELGESGAKADSALARLGTAVGKLDKAFRGMSGSQALAKQLEDASAASDRLEKSMGETAQESRRLAGELEKVSASATELAAKQTEAAAAVRRQAEAAKQAKTAQRDLNTTLRESTEARDKLVRAEDRLGTAIQKQEARVEAARTKFEDLSRELASTTEPTKTFQNRVEAAFQSLGKAEGKLTGLRTELEGTRGSIASANASLETLGQQLAEAAAKVEQTKNAVAGAKTEYASLSLAAKSAAQQQKALAQTQENLADTLDRQQGQYDQTKQSLGELAQRQEQARAAMAELAAEARGPLLAAFSQQQRSISQVNNTFQRNRDQLRQLSAEMGRVGVPTREMVEAYAQLNAAGQQIAEEYRRQSAALAQMRATLRGGVTDTDQLAAAQRNFAAILTSSSAGLTRLQGVAASAAESNSRIAAGSARAADQARRQATEQTRLGSTARSAAADTSKLAQAVRAFYGESRTAMSFTQRLRGEVLSLVSAYVGFYGVINVLDKTIAAYQGLEAAQSRLNVVMGGDQERTAQELDFLRRTAERLGIEFGTLAQEYSKFAVATKGTNLEGQNTRDIFVSVAEAARVNKTSMEDMAGTFVALTQIVSKGSVQMEELRQQLGDRLPGAIQIMADSLGVSTAELIKMTEQGQVSSDALVGFAAELTKRFGPQLAASLTSVTTQMGRFDNAITQTLLAFGKAGFMDAFSRLLKEIVDTMQSADFQAFITRLSGAMAGLLDVISSLIDNWRLLATAMVAIIGIRLLPVFVNLVGALRDMIYTARGAAQAQAIVAAQATATGAATAVAATGVGRLALAFRALMSSTGVGLLLTAAATAFTLWGTGANEASTAMEKHKAIVDKVRNAYDAADKSNQDWAKRIEGVTNTEVRVALESANAARSAAFDELYRQLGSNGNMFNVGDQLQNLVDRQASAQIDELARLIKRFEEGKIEADQFKRAVSTIAEGARTQLIQDMAEAILENAAAATDATTKAEELEAAQRVLNGTASEADFVLLGLAEAADAASNAFDSGNLESFTDAMREMAGFIPSLKTELETLKDLDAIDAAYNAAIANAATPMDWVAASTRRDQAIQAVLSAQDEALFKEIAGNTKVTQQMFQGIFGEESYRSQAYDDGYGNQTIGYGSTRIFGRAVQPGDVVTQQQAMSQAVQDMAVLVAQIEALVDVPLSDSQLEALVSYAYNAGIGSLARDGILAPLNRGDYAGAAGAIRNGVATSNGVFSQGLKDRRGREADLFASGVNDPAVAAELVKIERERLETAEAFHTALSATAEQEQRMIDLAAEGIIQRETEKAIIEAQNAAKEAGTVLSEAELQGIRDRTAAKFAEQAQDEAAEKVKEQRAAIEQRVNDLLAQRTELEAQLAIYRETGDSEKTAETEAAIIAVNDQLKEAIANATAMWQAVGGTAADAAIAKLGTAALEADKLDLSAKKNQISWQQVGQLFAGGLTNALMGFAQAVAQGEDAGEAARTAFLQFAADFLIKIAEMIIQQAILNALQSAFSGGGGGIGSFIGGLFGVGHTGGRVGSSRIGSGNGTRYLNPAIFTSAPRYHEGGVAGLRPGEVPAVLKEGEEILTENDPRHFSNQGSNTSASPTLNAKIVNMIDAASFISEGLNSKEGEEAVLNFMRANKSKVRAVIG